MTRRAEIATAIFLFLLVFVAHSLSRNSTPFDSCWSIPTILSLLNEGNADLNEFPGKAGEYRFYGVDCVAEDHSVYPAWRNLEPCPAGTRWHNRYPIGTSLIALPVFIAMDAALRIVGPVVGPAAAPVLTPMMRAFFERRYVETTAIVEIVIASFFVALTTVFIWLLFRRYLPDWVSVLAALVFAFGSPAWSTFSRALYQHGPLSFLIIIAIYMLIRGKEMPRLIPWTAVPLALGYIIRPTAVIVIAAIGAYILFHQRRHFLRWAALAALTVAPIIVYNLAIYRSPVMPYYTNQLLLPLEWSSIPPFLEAVAGNLISPNRGLFIFIPVLVFLPIGLWQAWRRRWEAPLTAYLAAAMLAQWAVICWYADWTAGHSYGPRYFTDVLVIQWFFLIPALQWVSEQTAVRRNVLVAALAVLSVAGVAIHANGAWNYDVFMWNKDRYDVNRNHWRAWDTSDWQVLR